MNLSDNQLDRFNRVVRRGSIVHRSWWNSVGIHDIQDTFEYGLKGLTPEQVKSHNPLLRDESMWKRVEPAYKLGTELGKEGVTWQDTYAPFRTILLERSQSLTSRISEYLSSATLAA